MENKIKVDVCQSESDGLDYVNTCGLKEKVLKSNVTDVCRNRNIICIDYKTSCTINWLIEMHTHTLFEKQ